MAPWLEFVRNRPRGVVSWRGGWIDDFPIVDGLSAAHGLAGYRYHRSGREWIDTAGDGPGDWRREWIVLASTNADPFIADLSRSSIPILLAPHDAREWRPQLVHRSIGAFVRALRVVDLDALVPDTPPLQAPADCSVTVLDWGGSRLRIIGELTRNFPHLYQMRMFVRRRVETPAILARHTTRPHAEAVLGLLDAYGAVGEIGPAVPRTHYTEREA